MYNSEMIFFPHREVGASAEQPGAADTDNLEVRGSAGRNGHVWVDGTSFEALMATFLFT